MKHCIQRLELAHQIDALLKELPERQRIALRLSYGLDGSPPLRQVQVRGYSVAHAAISLVDCMDTIIISTWNLPAMQRIALRPAYGLDGSHPLMQLEEGGSQLPISKGSMLHEQAAPTSEGSIWQLNVFMLVDACICGMFVAPLSLMHVQVLILLMHILSKIAGLCWSFFVKICRRGACQRVFLTSGISDCPSLEVCPDKECERHVVGLTYET